MQIVSYYTELDPFDGNDGDLSINLKYLGEFKAVIHLLRLLAVAEVVAEAAVAPSLYVTIPRLKLQKILKTITINLVYPNI